jgi:hypothetical protein
MSAVGSLADKVEFARLLKDQGSTLGEITSKMGIRRPRCTAISPLRPPWWLPKNLDNPFTDNNAKLPA